MKKTPFAKTSRGFTLIELLLVISIIALLASIAMYAASSATPKARNAKRVSDVSMISKGLALFVSQCGTYPALPPATTAIRLDSTKGLYTGTLADCGASDAVFGSNGVLPKGGIGNTHAAGSGETLFLASLPTAPAKIDDGSLTAGNRCSENNSQTGYPWGQYSYVSFAPADSTQYWIYFCIGGQAGSLQAGRYIMTEKGPIRFTGNFFP